MEVMSLETKTKSVGGWYTFEELEGVSSRFLEQQRWNCGRQMKCEQMEERAGVLSNDTACTTNLLFSLVVKEYLKIAHHSALSQLKEYSGFFLPQ